MERIMTLVDYNFLAQLRPNLRNAFHLVECAQFKRSLWTTKTGVLMVDHTRVLVQAGDGGQGLPRFNGIGGDGGDVIVIANPKYSVKKAKNLNISRLRAVNGQDATELRLVGQSGKNKIIEVPMGLDIVDAESNLLITRCIRPHFKYVLARGGQGACPENCFRATRGERFLVDFHMKLHPNVGLVGFPNAGKSTLMKALVPKAEIKIANYPFTTVKPQIGVIHESSSVNEGSYGPFSLSLADLPGLIEGSHLNRGRGLSFLKHLEYSDILLIVVDVMGFKLSLSSDDRYRSSLETVAILNMELENYNAKIVNKPSVLAVNKIDLSDGEEKARDLIEILSRRNWVDFVDERIRPRTPLVFHAIIPVAAREGRLGDLKNKLKQLYQNINSLDVV